MSGKNLLQLIKIISLMAASIFAAIICYCNVYALDDEAVFNDPKAIEIRVPSDIKWHNRIIKEKGKNGNSYKFVLKDTKLKVYSDNKLIWESKDSYVIQDILLADIDENEDIASRVKKVNRVNNFEDKELVVLLWKEGRYGIYRPFWIDNDETSFSQHIFTYNIEKDRVVSKWGSSFMGVEAKEMTFDDGILYLTHDGNEEKGVKKETETAWQWVSFGFEKIDDLKFVMAGDNLIHDYIYNDCFKNHNGDFDYLYERMKEYTKDADLSVINLETPLVNDPSRYSTYPCFGTPVGVSIGIKNAGFDAVTLSTNHRFDKGKTGIEETIQTLDKDGLLHVGSMDEKPYLLIKRKGQEIALLNYTYGTNGIKAPKGYEKGVNYLNDEEKIKDDIREAKKNSDFVIVFVHWGTEYSLKIDSMQAKWRKVFYDEGVDVVVGTHPHVIQEYEMYKEKDGREMLIYYSLGNYISGNQRMEHNGGGIGIFTATITSDGIKISGADLLEIDTMYKESKYR